MHIVNKLFLGACLAGLTSIACAQSDTQYCEGTAAGRLKKSDLRCDKEPETTTVMLETPGLTTTISTPEIVVSDCQATLAMDYTQRGALARVEGPIENTDCPASFGSFIVSIRTANENGEQSTQEYAESWQRSDDQTVMFSKDYEIGDNVDLIRVRTLQSKCKCSAPE